MGVTGEEEEVVAINLDADQVTEEVLFSAVVAVVVVVDYYYY